MATDKSPSWDMQRKPDTTYINKGFDTDLVAV